MILGIDTAGPVVGLALVSDDGLRSWSARATAGADALLLPALEALLQDAPPLTRVAVSVGPGAFTGLRVGVATALGLAFARGVPVVPVSSLAARALLVPDALVLAVLDAKKSRVYAGLFDTHGPVPRALSPEQDLAPDLVVVPPEAIGVGEGAPLLGARLRLAPDHDRCPAAEVARLGALLDPVDPGEVALRYLRPADAQPPRGAAP